jgi:hypothetical protein
MKGDTGKRDPWMRKYLVKASFEAELSKRTPAVLSALGGASSL